ncbi:40S ribosomal protein S5-1 [Hordeum vulgare]|nr:40S ribosomal protein S5-1 [Hordeum vulgare]
MQAPATASSKHSSTQQASAGSKMRSLPRRGLRGKTAAGRGQGERRQGIEQGSRCRRPGRGALAAPASMAGLMREARTTGWRGEASMVGRRTGDGRPRATACLGRGRRGRELLWRERGGEGEDKIFEKVINPYLTGVLQHPQSIEMHEGMLHFRDDEGPKRTGSMETRLEAMEQQLFKCQGMEERGLNDNHMMITEFINKNMIDANDIGKHLSRLYERIDQLQAQIYDVQNQNCEYEYRFK